MMSDAPPRALVLSSHAKPTRFATISEDPHGKSKSKPKKTKAKTKSKRRSSKFIWRRRDAEDSQCFNLQMDVMELQQQIQALHHARSLLQQRVMNTSYDADGSCVKLVNEYHRMVRLVGNAVPVDHILAFLQRTVAEDAVVNGQQGRDQIARQGRSRGFAGVKIEFLGARVLSTPDEKQGYEVLVKARSTFATVIKPENIAMMFPHVMQFPDVVAKLLHKPLEGEQCTEFTFDCRTGQIIRMDEMVDMVAAFAKLLPDPKELGLVFQGGKPVPGSPPPAYSDGEMEPEVEVEPSSPYPDMEKHQASSPIQVPIDYKAMSPPYVEKQTEQEQKRSDKMALASILS